MRIPEYPAWGIFIVRVVTGLLFAVHGWQKFAGGLSGVAGYFAKTGIPMPDVMAPFIATLELIGGILLIIGLATRWVSILFACEMAVTTFYVILPVRGWNSAELDRLLLAVALLFILAGPGAAAVDSKLMRSRPAARPASV